MHMQDAFGVFLCTVRARVNFVVFSFSTSSLVLSISLSHIKYRPTLNINVELINRMIFYNKIKSVMPFCRLLSCHSAMRLLLDHSLDATNSQTSQQYTEDR